MTLDLIHALGWYLVLAFIAGSILRARNYWAMVGMVYRSGERWPKLRALVGTHKAIFLRWPTILPLAATLVLTLANAYATGFVWPHARVTPEDLWGHPVALAASTAAGGAMGFLDFQAMFLFARLDRDKIEAGWWRDACVVAWGE